MWRRAAAAAALAGLWLVATGAADPAGAHAMLRGSDPAGGASLDRSPAAVTLHFTEAPDPALSVVHVLDTAGHAVSTGPAVALAGSRLRAPLPVLGAGTYTVTWRATSRVDGHVSQGAFAFGVGLPAMATPSPNAGAATDVLQGPDPLAVAARWSFFWGIALLLGAAAGRRAGAGLLRPGGHDDRDLGQRRSPARPLPGVGHRPLARGPRGRRPPGCGRGGRPAACRLRLGRQGAPTRARGEPSQRHRLAGGAGRRGIGWAAGPRARRARGRARAAAPGQPGLTMAPPAGRRRLDRRPGVAAGRHRRQAARGDGPGGGALLEAGGLEPAARGAQRPGARRPAPGRLEPPAGNLLRPDAGREAGV